MPSFRNTAMHDFSSSLFVLCLHHLQVRKYHFFFSFASRMWNLHCRLICRRRLNPASRCNPSKMIMPFSGDANAVKTASIVGVFRDTKTKTIHFSVNGNDQGVALQNIPRSIHGFLHLRSQGGKICATLMPDHREGTTNDNTDNFSRTLLLTVCCLFLIFQSCNV